jgi:hypothetical protein
MPASTRQSEAAFRRLSKSRFLLSGLTTSKVSLYGPVIFRRPAWMAASLTAVFLQAVYLGALYILPVVVVRHIRLTLGGSAKMIFITEKSPNPFLTAVIRYRPMHF